MIEDLQRLKSPELPDLFIFKAYFIENRGLGVKNHPEGLLYYHICQITEHLGIRKPLFRFTNACYLEDLILKGHEYAIQKEGSVYASEYFSKASEYGRNNYRIGGGEMNEYICCSIYDSNDLLHINNYEYRFLESPKETLQAILLFKPINQENYDLNEIVKKYYYLPKHIVTCLLDGGLSEKIQQFYLKKDS